MSETLDYLRRIVQIAGKYSLDELFETGWGHLPFTVTPRGVLSPVFRRRDVTFQVEYRLLDREVIVMANTGVGSFSIEQPSVAEFYRQFTQLAKNLGLPEPGSVIASELPGPQMLDNDERPRSWSASEAARILRLFQPAARGLDAWQAPWMGHRSAVGVMWGGFDLCTSRYLPRPLTPDRRRPSFLQWGMTEWCVTIGLDLEADTGPVDSNEAGSGEATTGPSLYAYIAPEPAKLDSWRWQVPGTVWDADNGLIELAWARVPVDDPAATIMRFADDVYLAAIELAEWPTELVRERFDGWRAGRVPPPNPSIQGNGSGNG